MPAKFLRQVKDVYSSCMKKGGHSEGKCSNIAWGTATNAYKKTHKGKLPPR